MNGFVVNYRTVPVPNCQLILNFWAISRSGEYRRKHQERGRSEGRQGTNPDFVVYWPAFTELAPMWVRNLPLLHPAWVFTLLVLGFPIPVIAHEKRLPWLEYRAVDNCPGRSEFESEWSKRVKDQPLAPPDGLEIDLQFDGTVYEGKVRLHEGDGTAERVVRHENCTQLVSAVAFIALMLLETERKNSEIAANPESKREAPSTSLPNNLRDGAYRSVTATPPTQGMESVPPRLVNGPKRYSWGPFFSLTAERSLLPNLTFGARIGVFFGINHLLPHAQEFLRLSVTQLKSDKLEFDFRSANFTWIGLRLDACHAMTNSDDSTLGGCALIEGGHLTGQGHVAFESYERSISLLRMGALLYLRQRIVGPLALSGDVGFVVPLTRPEFYFAQAETSEVSVFQPKTVGQMADVALELHF
jgi:hypothetical protein